MHCILCGNELKRGAKKYCSECWIKERARMMIENNPMNQEKYRRKIGNKLRGVPKSKEHRKALSLINKGKRSSIGTEFKIEHKINKSELRRNTNEYKSLHVWVNKVLGKPLICRSCGETEKRIEWANKSREYKKEVTDWIELCNKCHFSFDIKK